MTAAKHTPRPWVIGFRPDGFSAWFSMGDVDSGPHKQVTIGFERGKDEADARLIAAAPELLDALRKCVSLLEETERESGRLVEYGEEDPFRRGEWFEGDDMALFEEARAAIAKAEGQAPTDDARNCQIGAI